MMTMTPDGLVFLISIAIIIEFVLGIFVQGGEILPITLGPQLAMTSTVALGVAVWGIFLRKESPDTSDV
jgi:hypothetical protein